MFASLRSIPIHDREIVNLAQGFIQVIRKRHHGSVCERNYTGQ